MFRDYNTVGKFSNNLDFMFISTALRLEMYKTLLNPFEAEIINFLNAAFICQWASCWGYFETLPGLFLKVLINKVSVEYQHLFRFSKYEWIGFHLSHRTQSLFIQSLWFCYNHKQFFKYNYLTCTLFFRFDGPETINCKLFVSCRISSLILHGYLIK